jgi:glycosyltransferase involved in cell wall biosynthesis
MSEIHVTHVMAFDERPGLSPFSGAENHLLILLEAQQRAGLHVELLMLVMNDGPQLAARREELEKNGVFVHMCKVGELHPVPRKANKKAIAHLRSFFKTRQHHIIHTHLEQADYIGKVSAWSSGCRNIVSSTHNDEPFYALPKWRFKLRLLDKLTKHHIAITKRVKQHLIEVVGIAGQKITVVYYGVEPPPSTESRQTLRQKLGIPADAFVVGFVGRLMPQKNVELLIDALAELPEMHGVLIGAGELEQSLRQRAEEKQISNIQFLGQQPNAMQLMPAFDVFCLPSRWEGLGLVLIEAMLHRVPIIASRSGAIPEILNTGQYGILFESENKQGLVEALRFAHENTSTLTETAERAFHYARETFTIEAMVKNTTHVYRRVQNR